MVLVIIGVILAMVGPRVFNSLGRASSERAKVQIEQIGSALELYKLDTGRYPTTQEGLGALLAAPSGASNWNGPYLKDAKHLKDPWSRRLHLPLAGGEGRLRPHLARRRRQGRRRGREQGHPQLMRRARASAASPCSSSCSCW